MTTENVTPDRLSLDFYYLDESGHHTKAPANTKYFAMTGIRIPAEKWNDIFERIKTYRSQLRTTFGIPTYKEIHAVKLVSGRGRPNPKSFVSMDQRIIIYKTGLEFLTQCEDLGLNIIGVCLENQSGKDIYDDALQRMLDRIQRTAKETRRQAILVFDSGREDAIRRRMRRARVFNPIGSREGVWNTGTSARNIPTDRILGDPFFRNSEQDYFIQLADSTAYALLKYFEPPNSRDTTYKLKEMYDIVEPVTYKLASPRNKHGIVTN